MWNNGINILQNTFGIKYHIGLQDFSCQDHNDTVCVTGSHLQLTPTAMPVQQQKAQCINFLVLFFKEVFNIHIFGGCDLCSAVQDITSYNSITFSINWTQYMEYRKCAVVINDFTLRYTLYASPMCQECNIHMQFRALHLPYIAQWVLLSLRNIMKLKAVQSNAELI